MNTKESEIVSNLRLLFNIIANGVYNPLGCIESYDMTFCMNAIKTREINVNTRGIFNLEDLAKQNHHEHKVAIISVIKIEDNRELMN